MDYKFTAKNRLLRLHVFFHTFIVYLSFHLLSIHSSDLFFHKTQHPIWGHKLWLDDIRLVWRGVCHLKVLCASYPLSFCTILCRKIETRRKLRSRDLNSFHTTYIQNSEEFCSLPNEFWQFTHFLWKVLVLWDPLKVVFFKSLSLLSQQARRNCDPKEVMGQNTTKFMRVIFIHSEIIFPVGGISLLILLT